MCPLKYQLQYIDKVVWDFTPSNLALGSAVHAAIECFYRTHQDGSLLSSDDMIDLFSSFWDGQMDGKSLEPNCDPVEIKLLGQLLVDSFTKNVKPATTIAIEEQFTIPVIDKETGKVITDLKGVFDLVETDNRLCL